MRWLDGITNWMDKSLNKLWEWVLDAKSLQSFPTLCNPIDGSPPGSRPPARRCTPSSELTQVLLLLLSRFSRFRLCATPQTAAHQAPPSLGFSRQEHWSAPLTLLGAVPHHHLALSVKELTYSSN